MLILTRRRGESIRIGRDITITVLGTQGNQVHIGVAAPRHIAVDRAEISDRKRAGLWPSGKSLVGKSLSEKPRRAS